MSLTWPDAWLPELSASTQNFFRLAYGVLLLGTLVGSLPHARRFFLSTRWQGYAYSSLVVDIAHNPLIYPVLLVLWITVAVLLITGTQSVAAALVNLALCYYFFVWMRWRGLLRGMGAPGFMTYWLAAAVFLLELTLHHAPHWRGLALLVLQIDLAAILLSAGIHKLLTGYACNDGMQFGLVNPQWGYWYRLWRRVPPGHLLFRVLNHLAWSVELLAALLMLIPATRFLGAVLVVASFAFLVTQIRLFLLAEMVMLAGVLFFAPGTLGARALESLPVWPGTSVAGVLPGAWQTGLGAALWGYLLLLPLVHGGLALNYYGCRRLWALPQTALDVYANLFGIIVWRVFSADHTSFFVNIYRQRRAQPWSRELVTHHERPCSRFNHVAESIALVCIFTTLKYYPDNGALFSERLWRHARTLPRGAGEDLVFVYASIRVTPAGFVVTPVAEFLVDVEQETITKRLLEKQAARELHAARPGSAQRPARQPGSYAA